MSGKSITIKAHDGGTFSGYLATPASGSGPGILVLQEIFGVSAHIRSVVDRWAEEGYVALAPDLFWRLKPGVDLGFTPDDVKIARELGGRFDIDQGVRDIGDAIAALKSQPEFKGKVGAVGYCLGGRLAFLAAARLGVDAADQLLRHPHGRPPRRSEVRPLPNHVPLRRIGRRRARRDARQNPRRIQLRMTMPSFTFTRTRATPLTTIGASRPTIRSRRSSRARARSDCFAARSVRATT